jgi:hypothetical protein
VWLGSCHHPTSTTYYLIASASTKGIYYSFDGAFPAIGSVPALSPTVSQPTPLPSGYWPELSHPQDFHYPHKSWLYAKATLNNVQAVRKSQRGGIELYYGKFSVCLGDFRPSEALRWIHSPRGFTVSCRNDEIDFHRREDTSIDTIGRVEGFIIIWYCHDSIIFETESKSCH